MHPLLVRQLKKHLSPDVDRSTLQRLLEAVSEAYDASDMDRALLERSIELASGELYEQNQQLERDIAARRRLELELQNGEKLRAVGQLAAGIAHEINTPVQFVGDSVHFLRTSFQELSGLLDQYSTFCFAVEDGQGGQGAPHDLTGVRAVEASIDLSSLREDVKMAFERVDEGVLRVTEIVRAMKEFGHADQRETVAFDLNRGILNTLTVARNEIKHIADVELELDDLPLVSCNAGEINQVFLNLVVNAAHAISERMGPDYDRGKIVIRSMVQGDQVMITIADDGPGMPASVAARIFEPFFTTKEVGRGTGQGLPIARSIIVDKHAGSLTFETAPGVGTTFRIRLPIGTPLPASSPVSREPAQLHS